MSNKHIKLHIPYGDISAMGPGKADLLEAIVRHGSISGAARAMGMSYKRAWDLVDTMNRCFQHPLVSTAAGGAQGGGANVTDFGKDILLRYRDIEQKANLLVAQEIQALQQKLLPQK